MALHLNLIRIFSIFYRLESVLVQHEVAECIFEWHNESDHSKVTTLPTSVVALDREIHSILRRQNICVAAYIGFNSAPDTDLVVSELQNLTTSSSSLTSSALANDHTSAASASVVDTFQALHATTLLAAYSVLDYLQLWKQPAGHKTFDISIGAYVNGIVVFYACYNTLSMSATQQS